MTDLTEQQLATNAATWDHIDLVMKLLASAQIELMRRQFTHDRSKLRPPEVEAFTEWTPKLRASTYGSDEYKATLAAMKPALDHHYAHNRHHPEFFPQGERSEEIDQHIATANLGVQYGCQYPDDQFLYEKLVHYLDLKQKQHISSINQMNLFDLLEMLIDWVAAVKRHDDGDINRSIEINKDRFGMSDQLVRIFQNTVPWIVDEFEKLETQQDLERKL